MKLVDFQKWVEQHVNPYTAALIVEQVAEEIVKQAHYVREEEIVELAFNKYKNVFNEKL